MFDHYPHLSRPPLPAVKGADWPQNPIDFFVLKKLNDVGINPMPEAERRALVRRAHLDLTGLLPSFDEVVADQSYVELIDQLLASPRFGERQAQHWMDLARFAETDGFEHDKVRTTAWKYRDWVISAFNSNLPYDEFVMQQLAADEISADSDQTPTMFCLAGPDMPDINSQIERRHSLLNELTSTVGAVFMGLQVGCAQCHDHKFDPISQADFYRMRALFQPAVHVTKNQSVSALKEQGEPQPAYLMTRGDFDKPELELEPGFLRVVSTGCLLYTSPSPRDATLSRMPSSA